MLKRSTSVSNCYRIEVFVKLFFLVNCSNLVCLNTSKRVNQFLPFALYHRLCLYVSVTLPVIFDLLSSPDCPLIILIVLSRTILKNYSVRSPILLHTLFYFFRLLTADDP